MSNHLQKMVAANSIANALMKKGHGRVSEFPTAEVRGRVESAFRQRVVSDLLRSRVAKK